MGGSGTVLVAFGEAERASVNVEISSRALMGGFLGGAWSELYLWYRSGLSVAAGGEPDCVPCSAAGIAGTHLDLVDREAGREQTLREAPIRTG